MSEQPRDRLVKLLRRRRVVELRDLFEALGTRSRMTVFRRLREVAYRTSFTPRGQYYTLAEFPQLDEWGLWFHRDIGFSRSGTLKETIAVQAEQVPDGRTHGELSHLLGVRAHNPLLELVHEGRIDRERYRAQHLYVSADADRAAEQVRQRLAGERALARTLREPTLEETLEILGEALGCAGEIPSPLEVVRALAARGVAVEPRLVRSVYEAREGVHVCLAGCRQPSGSKVTRRAACLADSLPPGQTVGYDVMVLAGLQRFVHHRQREEVREALRAEHGVDISTGEVSIPQRRFVLYLQRLHAARRDANRQAFARDGGWPLQIEATGEGGRGTLLIAYAGWRRWVLGSWQIPTENADAIVPCLRQVAAAFGPPVAVVRDLGRAMTPAVLALVDESSAGRRRLSAPPARGPACSRPPRPDRLRSAVRAGGAHPALAGQPVRPATRRTAPGSQDRRPQPANPRAGHDDPARAGPSGSA